MSPEHHSCFVSSSLPSRQEDVQTQRVLSTVTVRTREAEKGGINNSNRILSKHESQECEVSPEWAGRNDLLTQNRSTEDLTIVPVAVNQEHLTRASTITPSTGEKGRNQ